MLTDREKQDLQSTMALTPREFEVALCVLDGMSNQRAAVALGMSRHTFDSHMRRIFDKLGVRNRASVVSQLFVTFVRTRKKQV